ncbi:hypothetical protein CBM2637_A110009 [Cupriavidus taiwanensis]|nr:hypothetical protein CBM2637_A110009 [Cupriavidus taiwanensis]
MHEMVEIESATRHTLVEHVCVERGPPKIKSFIAML